MRPGHNNEMTRFGVMKHLRVLEDAGLVVSRDSNGKRVVGTLRRPTEGRAGAARAWPGHNNG